jgi:uncharacterized protein
VKGSSGAFTGTTRPWQVNIKLNRTEFFRTSLPPAKEEELASPAVINRISSLDVLRGVAIMGILASNIQDFGGISMYPVESLKPAFSGSYAFLNTVLFLVQQVFFSGKTRGMLAFLFGAGVQLLTDRLDKSYGRQACNTLFVRRYLWIMIFGVLHAFFIWDGDFLQGYGATALVLLSWCRRFPSKTLLLLGIVLATIPATYGMLLFNDLVGDVTLGAKVAVASAERAFGKAPSASLRAAQEQWGAKRKPYLKGRDALEQQARAGQKGYSARFHQNLKQFFGLDSLLLRAATLDLSGPMLIGIVLARTGFLLGKASTRTYGMVAFFGFLLSAPLTFVGVWHALKSGLAMEVIACWVSLPAQVLRIGMGLAYISIILLWVRSRKGKLLLNVFAATGRMAMTNYLLTSILCQTIFVWGPWKLYGEVEYFQLYLCVLGVWGFNLLFSSLWLRWFSYGPVEWMWRCLTYRRLLPISVAKQA